MNMAMNFLTLLIVSLILITISMMAIGINLLLGRKSTLKAGSCGAEFTPDGERTSCGCGAANCCAGEQE
jgi:hypothetical protein